MQTVDENPDLIEEKVETIHLYVVREEKPRPSTAPIVLSLMVLILLIILGVAFPYRVPLERKTIRLPVVFLPLQTFTTSSAIVPTGIKTNPATKAEGILTITNGSVVSQTLPSGIIFSTQTGIEVETKTSVFVPSGSAEGYGIVTVRAKAIVSGIRGNIPSLSINQVFGTSIYIRNLTSFTGGKDAYSVKVVTPQDIQIALENARIYLTSYVSQIKAFLAYPCKESIHIKNNAVGLLWSCQYVTYSIFPNMKVTSVRLVGKSLLVDVVFVAKPSPVFFK